MEIVLPDDKCFACDKDKRKYLYSMKFRNVEYCGWLCGWCHYWRDQYGLRYLVLYKCMLYGKVENENI